MHRNGNLWKYELIDLNFEGDRINGYREKKMFAYMR